MKNQFSGYLVIVLGLVTVAVIAFTSSGRSISNSDNNFIESSSGIVAPNISTSTTTTLPNDVLDYLESIVEVQKEVVALEKKVTLDNKKWINAEITYGTAKELFLDNIKTANIMFNKFAEIKAPPYKNLKGVHTNFILLVRELSLNTQYLYEGLVFIDYGEQREYIYNIFSQNYIIFDNGINDLIESVTVDGKTLNPKKPVATTTTLAPTTTTTTLAPTTTTTTLAPTTTTTTLAPTTTTTTLTSDEKYGITNFKTRRDYHQHILDLNFFEGFRGYEGDFVIKNSWEGKNWDCSPANNARGCRSFYEVFPAVSGLNFSLPNGGGNRAFGELTISLPKDHQILSVSAKLSACRNLDLNCARSSYPEYTVYLTDYTYSFRDFDELPEYYFDLVGKAESIGSDQSFFYSGYYYFLKSFTVSLIDESDPLRWQGILDYRVVPGVGTYVWQVGWDGPYNVGWLNPSYNFIYSSLDTYQNTPYFRP
jgi:hypothetical protein